MILMIRRRHGIWCCCFVDRHTRMALPPMGHGYTPGDALAEWQAIRQEQR